MNRKKFTVSLLVALLLGLVVGWFFSPIQHQNYEVFELEEEFSDLGRITGQGTGTVKNITDGHLVFSYNNIEHSFPFFAHSKIYLDPITDREDYRLSELEDNGCADANFEDLGQYLLREITFNDVRSGDAARIFLIHDKGEIFINRLIIER